MAQEAKRGCGYRRVGGMYLCGGYSFTQCDRLPYLLDVCPVCGGGVKVSRGFTEINPLALFDNHEPCKEGASRWDCHMCAPKGDIAYIMGVGESFYSTPEVFMKEALEMGISKRIPHTWLPRGLEVGKTVIYLAHPKACMIKITHSQQRLPLLPSHPEQPRFIEAQEIVSAMGIFTAFIPQRIEKLIWESQATKETIAALKEREITPVIIKDGDPDHE